jgi:pathogenesis-related protein 1
MRQLPWIAAVLASSACGFGMESASEAPPPADPTPAGEAQAWLDTQNAVRHAPKPAPPSPLPDLTWSAAAAAVAQDWADRCNYQHNPGRGNRGENIAASSPQGRWAIADAVSAWAGEVADYDYARNSCAPGKDCGHYTQIVWRSSVRAGCAHRACQTNSPFGAQFPDWDFWVCDYEPPGNVVGQRPY